MKNTLEAVAVGLVILLSLGLVGLIVQYNMIETDDAPSYTVEVSESLQTQEADKKPTASSYLDKLEGYEDVDVKVDPTSEDTDVNIAVVESEAGTESMAGSIGSAVETVEKQETYVTDLEGYEDKDIKVDPKQQAEANIATVEGTSDEGVASDIHNVVTSEAGEPVEEEKSDEESLTADPLGDIVSDIDSIISASE